MGSKTTAAASRAEAARLRRELKRLRELVNVNRAMLTELLQMRRTVTQNADAIESLRKECAANLRRCGELQADVDTLRKQLSRAS